MRQAIAACRLAALGLTVTLVMPAGAAAPFAFDAAPGRLPKDIVPRRYTIAVQPGPRHELGPVQAVGSAGADRRG
jgi:hypothetical protein